MGSCCSKSSKSNANSHLLIPIENPENKNSEASQHPTKSENNELIFNNSFLLHQTKGTPLEKYQIVKSIEEDSFGLAYLVQNLQSNLLHVMNERELVDLNSALKTKIEIDNLLTLNHPKIVKLYESYYHYNKFYVISEFFKNGDLEEFLKSENSVTEEHAAAIVYQILLAIEHAKSKGLTHFNLKPQSILIEGKDRNGHILIKIANFGISKFFPQKYKLEQNYHYMAPELFEKTFSEKTDIWSLGVLLYQLISGRRPFESNTNEEIINKIKYSNIELTHQKFEKISKEFIDFISSCLVKDHNSRISLEDALNSAWIQKYKNDGFRPRKTIKGYVPKNVNIRPLYRLQQVALSIIIHNLPHNHHIREIVQVFSIMDVNRDGKLTREELKKGLILFNNSEEDAEIKVSQMFNNVDKDNNGYIMYEEFIKGTVDKNLLLEEQFLRLAFNSFDNDGSGNISKGELRNLLFADNFDDNFMNDIIAEVDLDKEGVISFYEFKNMMEKILNWKE